MSVFSFVTSLFDPATRLLDELITSEEEKLQAKASLLQIQTAFLSKVLDYETRLMDAQASIITTEAKSDSWITRTWRPIIMLSFGAIVVYAYIFQRPPPPELMLTINIGLGGYIGGRSVEKFLPKVVRVLKEKDST